LAGRHPERVLVVTDLDWGQDLLRLASVLRERKIDSVTLVYHGNAELSRHNLPPWKKLQPCQPATGWIAIDLQTLKMGFPKRPSHGYAWLESYQPVAVVGKSIRLYFIPQGSSGPMRNVVSGVGGCPALDTPSEINDR